MGMMFITNFYIAQTTKELKPVIIVQKQDSFNLNSLEQQLSKKEINSIPNEDVGVVTQKFTGVSLKNYGGLGGLKTISFRGISGNHSVILLNEFVLNNQQTGQYDLGSIQAENIENVRFTVVSKPAFLYPVSSLVSSNTLDIQTYEKSFNGNDFQIRLSSKVGSFNQFDNYLSVKKITDRKMLSVFAKYRSFDGDYPYRFLNGTIEQTGVRTNNNLLEVNTGVHFGIINGDQRWNMSYHLNHSDKGLPGAIILYNDYISQKLVTQNHFLTLEKIKCRSLVSTKFYSSFQVNDTKYSDPSYLNTVGELIQKYQNNSIIVGNVFNKILKDSASSFYGGIEYQLHTLKSENTTLNYNPFRNIGLIAIGVNLFKRRLMYQIQFNTHQVYTLNEGFNSYNSYFTGAIYIENLRTKKVLGIPRISLKRTLRLPTFGEMFINTVIKKEIKPEIVNQINFGVSNYFKKCKIGVDIYTNFVENKIITIPTKNLFLWSVQNIGFVFSNGCDFAVERIFFEKSKIQFRIKANYSYQSVIDYSSKSSPTYRHQVSYIPKHSANFDFNIEMSNKVSLNFSNFFISSRYALNENVESNLVAGFSTSDLSCQYIIKFKNRHELRCSFSVKNAFNTSYQYIRYFVMPGRNYLLSFSYAI